MSKGNVDIILKENKIRQAEFNLPYDPISGVGSYIPRFKVNLGSFGVFYLPISMKSDNINVFEEAAKKNLLTDKAFLVLMKERELHDFEFYAYMNLHIKDKETGLDIKFVLNFPQRSILLPSIYDDINNNRPIRQYIVKARQWGGSTLIEAVSTWIQRMIKSGWNSCIVADVEGQTRNIRAMLTNFSRCYPKESGKLTIKNFEGSSKNKFIEETGSVISIGSMQKPDSLRSGDIKMAHLTEVGLWKATLGKSPEDLIQSLRGTIPRLPWTMFVLESTAKGTGNYFHREYKAIKEGRSDLALVFVGWHQIPRYQMEPPQGMAKYVSTWGEREYELWDIGATIEGIYWYFFTLDREFKGDLWRMCSEFPTSAEEAFQTTGRKYFPPQYIKNLRKYSREPEFRGDVFGDGVGCPDCLNNVHFEEVLGGDLWIWAEPDLSIKIKNRYAVVIDVGGRHAKADYSVIRVLDRYPLMFSDSPEIVATWVSKLDYDLVAWKGAQISKMYCNALLIVESNFYDARKKKGESEGDYTYTVLDTISNYYDNLFTRTTPDKVREGAPVQWGFHTNGQTKPMVLGFALKLLRENGYIEPDHRACDEYQDYEIKTDGTFGAPDGQHDDILMATVILLWVAFNRMDLPCEYEDREKRTDSNIKGVSSF